MNDMFEERWTLGCEEKKVIPLSYVNSLSMHVDQGHLLVV